jgi:hypothetical protein
MMSRIARTSSDFCRLDSNNPIKFTKPEVHLRVGLMVRENLVKVVDRGIAKKSRTRIMEGRLIGLLAPSAAEAIT